MSWVALLATAPKIYVIIFLCDQFLSLPKLLIRARVLGKRVNRGAGYSFEIHVCFIFQGHVKEIAWVKNKNKIEDAEKMVQSRIEKCMKNAL